MPERDGFGKVRHKVTNMGNTSDSWARWGAGLRRQRQSAQQNDGWGEQGEEHRASGNESHLGSLLVKTKQFACPAEEGSSTFGCVCWPRIDDESFGAGDRDRTGNIQLGKLLLYTELFPLIINQQPKTQYALNFFR